jgi:hypothetical protein
MALLAPSPTAITLILSKDSNQVMFQRGAAAKTEGDGGENRHMP